MALTRKDFVEMAEIVKDFGNLNVPCVPDHAQQASAIWLARRFADVCAKHNPRFNRARFMAACEVEQD